MSGIGKFCLVVTLLLLLVALLPIPSPYGGWVGKVLIVHNEWAQELRDNKAELQKAIEKHEQARLELTKAAADIDAIAIGWDRVWHVPAASNSPQAPRVQVQPNGNLLVFNLGANQGLGTVQTTDENGNQVTLQPMIYAFFGQGEGVSYAGEFKAVSVNPTGVELRPVYPPSPQEVSRWGGPNAGWRLRSLIPGHHRGRIDELHRSMIRVQDLIRQANANIANQQALLTEAQQALAVRRGELLGDPNREAVPDRPEFQEGLLKVTEETEEQRNQLAFEVDTLRRRIKAAGEARDARIQQLKDAADSLPAPGASGQNSTPTPKVARGK